MADLGYRFSERFGVTRASGDDWFDVLLPSDTELFVDPFRIYSDGSDAWKGAHDELIDFFNLVLELMALANLDPASAHFNAAAGLLMFPEPVEFCLGYSQGSDGGRGSAKTRRNSMLAGGAIAINAGMTEVTHFEEMTLFEGRVGPDLISDITCNVLKNRFIDYTLAVCEGHDVELERVPVKHASWSREHRRWENNEVELPYNPWTKAGTVLVPQRFLRQLPSIDGDAFWDSSWAHEAEQLRGQFQYDVARNVSSTKIAQLARLKPDLVRKFVKRFERDPRDPYDLDKDPRGRVRWYEAGLELATTAREVEAPEKPGDFCDWVGKLCREFVWVVEQRDGWRLLWNPDGTPRRESAVQQLFHVALVLYCKDHDIDFTPESSAGRGPVDFKFSQGWERRAVVEVKLAKHSKFWRGLDTQTPIYMGAEGIKCGYFLAVQFTDNDFTRERIDHVHAKAKAVSAQHGYGIKPVFVDARTKKSGSKA